MGVGEELSGGNRRNVSTSTISEEPGRKKKKSKQTSSAAENEQSCMGGKLQTGNTMRKKRSLRESNGTA